MIKKPASSTITTKVVAPTPIATPKVITVVVLDTAGRPTANARVSITPSDASGVTDSTGKIQFTLGSAIKYEITASYGSSTVTVPYYVTQNGATQLVVNPVYVKSVEAKLHGWNSPLGTAILSIVGIILGIIIIFVIIRKFFPRKNKKQNKKIP